MASLTPEVVLDTALWILLCEKKFLNVEFLPECIRVYLPSQRELAVHCSVSMTTMMLAIAGMELQDLIRKAERVGIWTTPQGNRMIADIIGRKYQKEVRAVLGPALTKTFLKQLTTTLDLPADQTGDTQSEKSSSDNGSSYSSGEKKILKRLTCICCHRKFYTNDRRRKYCDHCKDLSPLGRVRIQTRREQRHSGPRLS